jgi:phosphoribosylamine--glycine ligase
MAGTDHNDVEVFAHLPILRACYREAVKVLIAGSGGREHALAWRLAQSPSLTALFAVPGNPGIAQVARCLTGFDTSPQSLLRAAREIDADVTVIGPEAPLVDGVVDVFRAAGRRIVGPTQANARLEGSKVFAKHFFAQHKIPTAAFHTCQSADEASAVLDRSRFPIVLKTDGLAAGKGVVVAQDRREADAAVATLGPRLVIEEFLQGEEVSFIVLSDGRDFLTLEPCQDHKAIYDGDLGPNTGGMGAYCDSRILTVAQREQILDRIIRPTIAATGFTGFLFAGLIMTADGPRLLEFNVRLGDPETQAIVHRMVADLGQVLLAASESRLRGVQLDWRPEPSLCVVLASAGYPQTSQSGIPIRGIAEAEGTGATVFQAGTRLGADGQLETAGGRVLGVTARGPDLASAIQTAYAAVDRVRFDGMQYRGDIGRKGLRRYNNEEARGT